MRPAAVLATEFELPSYSLPTHCHHLAQNNPNHFAYWIKIYYSASRRATMSRASISFRTRMISTDFRSKAANTFFTKGESVIFSLPEILAGGLGRAGGRFFGTPLACLDDLARNSNPK